MEESPEKKAQRKRARRLYEQERRGKIQSAVAHLRTIITSFNLGKAEDSSAEILEIAADLLLKYVPKAIAEDNKPAEVRESIFQAAKENTTFFLNPIPHTPPKPFCCHLDLFPPIIFIHSKPADLGGLHEE